MLKCPFDKKKCNIECVLYRKGIRYYEGSGPDGLARTPQPFEDCAINIGVDCLENMVSRSISQQKATEQTRNELIALKELFYSLATRKALEAMHKNEIIEVTD